MFAVAITDDYGVVTESVRVVVDDAPLDNLKCAEGTSSGGTQSSQSSGGSSSSGTSSSSSQKSSGGSLGSKVGIGGNLGSSATGRIPALPPLSAKKSTTGSSSSAKTGTASSSGNSASSSVPAIAQQLSCFSEQLLLPGVHTYYAEAKDKTGNKGRDPATGAKTVIVGSEKPLKLEIIPGSVTFKKVGLKWNKYDDKTLSYYLVQAKPVSVPEAGKRGHGKKSGQDVWTTVLVASGTDTTAVVSKLRPNREYQLRVIAMKGQLAFNAEDEITDEAEAAVQVSTGGEDQSSEDQQSSSDQNQQSTGGGKLTPPALASGGRSSGLTGQLIALNSKTKNVEKTAKITNKQATNTGGRKVGNAPAAGGGLFKGNVLPQDALQVSNIVNTGTTEPSKLAVSPGAVSGSSLEIKWDLNSIKPLVDEAKAAQDVTIVLRMYVKEASQTDDYYSVVTDADGNVLNIPVEEGTLTLSGLTPQTEYTTRLDIYGIGSAYLIDSSDPITVKTAGITAVIVAAPTSGLAPLDVSFDGSQSSSPVGEIVSYEWNFGDGSDAEFGATAIHTYEASGTFTTTLTVTDDSGNQGINSVTIDTTGNAALTTTGGLDDSATTDTDGDGVTDNIDVCADTPAGIVADAVGCPDQGSGFIPDDQLTQIGQPPTIEDSDADGILDNYDACPGTSSGVSVDGNGCEVGQNVQKTSCTVDDFKRSRVLIGFDITQIANSCGKSGKWLADIFRSEPTDAQPTGVQGRDNLPDQRDACSAIIPDLENGIDTHRVYCGLDDSWYYVTYSAALKQG